MQPELSLLYREEEREMLPLCRDQGVGVIPWSPLAPRPADPALGRAHAAHRDRRLRQGAVRAHRGRPTAASPRRWPAWPNARGVPRAQVALAWVLGKPGVTAPIIGASRPDHLTDAVAALALELSAEETRALEAPYLPHAVVGFAGR